MVFYYWLLSQAYFNRSLVFITEPDMYFFPQELSTCGAISILHYHLVLFYVPYKQFVKGCIVHFLVIPRTPLRICILFPFLYAEIADEIWLSNLCDLHHCLVRVSDH